MAVSGVTGGGTSIYGSRNVISGLASGMDTESMIENMTKATRMKIAQQNQKKTLLGWKQTAYQGISTQLIDFSKKYMDYTSSTNLLSSAFFDQSITTSVGNNSGFISATGKTDSKVEINGVGQVATHGKYVAQGAMGKQTLVSKDIDITGEVDHSKMAGGTFTFEYGKDKYTITLDPAVTLKTKADVANEINRQLKETKTKNGNLGDVIKVSVDYTKEGLKFESVDKNGNTVKLVGASETVQEVLGLNKTDLENGIDLTKSGGFSTGKIEESQLTQKQKTMDFLLGKTLTLSFNGEKEDISLLTEEDKKAIESEGNDAAKKQKFMDLLQNKLDVAFGKDKIKLENQSGGGLAFKVTNNSTDVLRVVDADSGFLGKDGVFGFNRGDGNRLNLDSTLDSLLGGNFKPDAGKDTQELQINGVTIGHYTKDTTIGDIMRDISAKEEAGVKVTYSELTNDFVFTTKETGANHKIEISGGLAENLFGKAEAKDTTGKDAEVYVTIDGGAVQKLTRHSNEIDINGLKVTVSGEFGYNDKDYAANKVPDKTENVTFESKPDTEKVFDAIKEMVEDYNKIVDSVYKEMTTKPNRDYKPLTEEQKKEMSKEQIEKWEEKAKEGILFADTQLRSLHDSLRFIFNPGGEAGAKLREMGITPATDYKDGGKIKLDETKLKAALEKNPESVKQAFNTLASDSGDTNNIFNGSKGGVMTQMKALTDRFASTSLVTPGILVERAGSPSSPNSMMKNTLQKEIDGVDKYLKDLDKLLKKEVDRYNSQFTQLEKLISQMNAQSAQLAGLMGGM